MNNITIFSNPAPRQAAANKNRLFTPLAIAMALLIAAGGSGYADTGKVSGAKKNKTAGAVKSEAAAGKKAASKAMLIEEDDSVFDESEILESLNEINKVNEIKRVPQKKPRMNNPPAPPYWDGFDYDTVETNMNEILSRFKAHDEYYEPRYKHYQDDNAYKIQSVRRDKIKNLINAQSVAQQNAEVEKLLSGAGRPKEDQLNYVELLDCGIQRLFKSDFKNALRFFSKAVRTDPRQPEGYYNMALTYFYRNNVPLAIINFRRAIDLKPDLAEAYNNIGVCYIRANLIEKGVSQLRQANIYAPTMKEAIDNLYELKNKDLDYNYNDKLFREKHSMGSSSPARIFSLRLKLCQPLLNLSNIEKDENRIHFTDTASAYDKLAGEYKTLILDTYPDIDITLKASIDIENKYNKYWDALNLLKIGDELYEKKLYRESEKYYTQVLKILPGICSVHLKRGFTRLDLKNYRGAEYDFSFAAKNSDDDNIVREGIKQIQEIRKRKFDSF
jgi:tetratricopeptide (TPR) repeat protein